MSRELGKRLERKTMMLRARSQPDGNVALFHSTPYRGHKPTEAMPGKAIPHSDSGNSCVNTCIESFAIKLLAIAKNC